MSVLQAGDKVRHPKMPDWGIGKIIELSPDGKARVFFIHAGEKLLQERGPRKGTDQERGRIYF